MKSNLLFLLTMQVIFMAMVPEFNGVSLGLVYGICPFVGSVAMSELYELALSVNYGYYPSY